MIEHKDLLPLDEYDYVGAILIGVGLMIAASGGVGGGGIVVPLLILVFGFHPKYAIPLSNFTILGSSIMNMILNVPKVHPTANRPLVDWDLILVMEPLTMAGSIVGAIIGKVLPDYILVISLVALLAYTTYGTLTKAVSQYKKETKALEDAQKSELTKANEDLNSEELEKVGLLEEGAGAGEAGDGDIDADKSGAVEMKTNTEKGSNGHAAKAVEKAVHPRLSEMDQELANLLEEESHTPQDKVMILSGMVGVVIVLNLAKGGTSFSPLGIECGSNSYWALTGLVFVFVIGISFYMRHVLIEKWKLKKRLFYKYLPGDVEWNERNTIVYPCLCFFAGFVAGMFGIGGGIVKGPLMLQMGVHPLVASATCAVMIMFTSVAATTMYIAFGTLTWDYGWFLFVLGTATTMIGQFGVSYLVEKYKRYSYISMSIGAVVALSTLLMGLQSILTLVDAQENGSPPSTICGN